jgi:phosphatidylserine/phosphatidylglycerophosphate/cardiolipin synthase-like enzyme
MIDAKEEEFLRRIHPYAEVAGQVLEAFAEYPGNWLNDDFIVRAARLPGTKRRPVLELLSILVELNILERKTNSWAGAKPPEQLRKYALIAESVGLYLDKIHLDKNIVEVVVTKPRQPSVLDRFLPDFGRAHHSIETTEDAFFKIASTAKKRLVLMSPFIDAAGVAWVIELFSRTASSVERVLIIRELEALDEALLNPELDARFRALDVRVFGFKVDKLEADFKYETFHAKALLADRSYFYVGSFNLTAYSLSYSMEMGVAIKGAGAAPVAQIVDTIIAIASRIS